MKVLYVCTELFPLLKTGGLGDVSAALPPALRDAGCDVRVLLPGFPAIRSGVSRSRLRPASPLALPDGDGPRLAGLGLTRPPSLQPATLPGSGLAAYVLDVRALFDRPGNPYEDAHGDNGIRFALLGWAAACLGLGLDPRWQPDVVHCHDWHTAPGAAVPAADGAARVCHRRRRVFTVHNLAYQGLFPHSLFRQLGLPDHLFGIDGIEFWGQVSFLKAGLQFADRITTVSPTYAREILEPEQGCGLDGLLRARSGGGFRHPQWRGLPDVEPRARPPCCRSPMTGTPWTTSARPRRELQRKMGLEVRPDAMVVGVVSRLTEQKGLHLVEAVADELVSMGGQLAVLGAGDGPLEQAFRAGGRKASGPDRGRSSATTSRSPTPSWPGRT